jgi:putative aminopeptidase FrvX
MSDQAKAGSPQGSGSGGVPPLLAELLAARGPSGYETVPARVWREAAGKFAEVSSDIVGTPRARAASRRCRCS